RAPPRGLVRSPRGRGAGGGLRPLPAPQPQGLGHSISVKNERLPPHPSGGSPPLNLAPDSVPKAPVAMTCTQGEWGQGQHRKPHAERSPNGASTERVRMLGAAAPLTPRNDPNAPAWVRERRPKAVCPAPLPRGERGGGKRSALGGNAPLERGRKAAAASLKSPSERSEGILQGSAATASRVPSVARRDGSPLEENRENTKLLICMCFIFLSVHSVQQRCCTSYATGRTISCKYRPK